MITKQPITQQRGTGMIEVMVAAIIIGIGLLGIAALQASSMQASTGAAIRSKATDLTAAMIDRVRANLVADNCYCYPYPTISCVATGALLSTCSTSTSARTMASNDLGEIATAVGTELPSGLMTISCSDKVTTDTDPCTKGSTMYITISWRTQIDRFGGFQDSITTPFVPGAP